MEFTERLKAYFEALDENATWDSVKPLFDDMMHQDLKVVTADGVLTKNQWEQAVKGLVAQGAKSSDIEISSDQDDTVYYRLRGLGGAWRSVPFGRYSESIPKDRRPLWAHRYRGLQFRRTTGRESGGY